MEPSNNTVKLLRRMRLLQHTHISSSPWRPDLRPCNKMSHVQNEIILGPVPHMPNLCFESIQLIELLSLHSKLIWQSAKNSGFLHILSIIHKLRNLKLLK